MPFQIIRNDITRVEADAIVNTANPHPVIGTGTDAAVYKAAGEEQLLAERKKIGEIPVGQAAVTSAFNLPARYIIHTVGPKWIDGTYGEEAALRSCYNESLKLAESLSCESIAFPLLAAGNYGFPKDLALKTATTVIYDFLMEHDMMVYLVVFDRQVYDLSGKLFQEIRTYVDENYVAEKRRDEYNIPESLSAGFDRRRRREDDYYHLEYLRDGEAAEAAKAPKAAKPPKPVKAPKAAKASKTATPLPGGALASPNAAGSLDEQLRGTGSTFGEHLLKLIIDRNMKNSEVYNGANISKQTFSKIMSNPNYHPTKNTACALAISLHLSPGEADELLEKAGMILSRSSKFDIAVRYFLENRMYNIVEDNIILYDNQLDMLGMS